MSVPPDADATTTPQAVADHPASHDQLLRRAAARWGDRTAVEAPSGSLTWAELDDAVTRAAASIRRVAEEGDVVAVALGHDLDLFIAPFVASRAGIRVLPLPPAAAPSTWTRLLRAADPVAVVADRAHLAAATAAGEADHHLVIHADLAWALEGHVDVDFAVGEGTADVLLVPTPAGGLYAVASGAVVRAAAAHVAAAALDVHARTRIPGALAGIDVLVTQVTAIALVGGTAVLVDDPIGYPAAGAPAAGAPGPAGADSLPQHPTAEES